METAIANALDLLAAARGG